MELERILRSQGFGSRPDCRALVVSGKVKIDGVLCDNPYEDISPEGLHFSVDEVSWRFRKFVYLLLNKPSNYECSQKPLHHPSVYALLPRPLITRGVQAVGRLDEDTTGLLLLSDDGQFIHTYTSPKKMIPKVYDITVKHALSEAQATILRDGVLLHGESTLISAADCVIQSDRLMRMTITEGKYHLVKRMIAAVGNRVEALNRVSIGGLTLPADLALGQWIWLESSDLAQLSQG